MYKEVAVDPKCMESLDYYYLLKRECGFEKGRYIAAQTKEWAKEAMQYLKEADLQDIKKQSIKNFLNKTSRSQNSDLFILAPDRKAIAHINWLEWYKKQVKHRPFSVTISERETLATEFECFNHNQIIEEECDKWNVPVSLSVERKVVDLINPIRSLLYLSKEVILIDPHFKLSDNNFLEHLFTLIQQIDAIKKLTIAVAYPDTPIESFDNYKNYYQNLNKNNISIKVILFSKDFCHDRYFITDVGAFRFGHGFDCLSDDYVCSTPRHRTNINIVAVEEIDYLKQRLYSLIDTQPSVVKINI